MEFCPRCGSILFQKGAKNACTRCHYSTKGRTKIKSSEKLGEKKEIAVVSERESQVFPITTETCRKCKNDKAYFWTVQTRSGDEAETKFFKCTKCEHTWREYH
jgi:DNA-directed RNA polymerase subunit M